MKPRGAGPLVWVIARFADRAGGTVPAMAPGMTPYLKWLLRARPADYALAVSLAGASLPVAGRHLEPLAGLTAMGMWAPGTHPR